MIAKLQLCPYHAGKVREGPVFSIPEGFTALCGPNGSGKSMMLRAIHSCDRCAKNRSNSGETRFFDTETMNPRSSADSPGSMLNMTLRIRARFSSHGEILKAALFSMPLKKGDTVLIDEPESGQDIAGIEKLLSGFEAICRAGGQVVVASHHPLLLQENVIELAPGYAEKLRQAYRKTLCPETQGRK